LTAKTNILSLIIITFASVFGYGQGLPFACTGSRAMYGVTGFENSVFDWAVEGGEIIENMNDTIVVEWNYSRGSHSISVVEITEYGCIGDPVTATVDVTAPKLDLGDEIEICDGDSFAVEIEDNYITPLEYLWHDGSTLDYFIAKEAGLLWAQVTGTDGCTDYDSVVIIVNPLPVVALGEDTSLCGTQKLEIDAGMFSFYQWSTGAITSSIVASPSETRTDTITVTVTDANGCKGTDTILILQCSIDAFFGDIPNTITPNNDGDNDVWIIEHLELFPGATVEIFDRWGRLIYRKVNPDPENVWDGKSQDGKEMPMDSYYYVIDFKYYNAKPLVGNINIIK
jgi:gliding motility-associated-like protein